MDYRKEDVFFNFANSPFPLPERLPEEPEMTSAHPAAKLRVEMAELIANRHGNFHASYCARAIQRRRLYRGSPKEMRIGNGRRAKRSEPEKRRGLPKLRRVHSKEGRYGLRVFRPHLQRPRV